MEHVPSQLMASLNIVFKQHQSFNLRSVFAKNSPGLNYCTFLILQNFQHFHDKSAYFWTFKNHIQILQMLGLVGFLRVFYKQH